MRRTFNGFVSGNRNYSEVRSNNAQEEYAENDLNDDQMLDNSLEEIQLGNASYA